MLKRIREPDKKRYLRAVKHEESEEVPFVECEVDWSHVNKILGEDLPPVRSYMLEAKKYAEFLKRTCMDMAYVHVPWKFGRKEITDERGISIYAGGAVRDYSDLDDLKAPDAGSIERRLEEILDALEETDIGIIYSMKTPDSKVREALGYERYFLYLMDKPVFVKDFLRRVHDILVEVQNTVFSYPVEAIRLSGPPCSKTGAMMSMEMMDEFVFPYLKDAVSRAQRRNVIVSLHADGNHSELYPMYVEMGVNVCDAIEKCAGAQDVMELKELYGSEIAFHGTIDVDDVLIKGCREDVEREVGKHIRRLGKGGGYICGSSHDINEDIPFENFIALAGAAVKKY